MTLALALMALWAVTASLLPLLVPPPGRQRAVWALVALGIPLVGLLTWQHGPWVGMLVLGAGVVLLRWSVARVVRRSRDTAVR